MQGVQRRASAWLGVRHRCRGREFVPTEGSAPDARSSALCLNSATFAAPAPQLGLVKHLRRRRGGSPTCATRTVVAVVSALLCLVACAPAQAHVPYKLFAWGYNSSGQLGDGIEEEGPEACFRAEQPCAMSPQAVTGLPGVVTTAGGEEHTIALVEREGGTAVMAWG